MVNLIDIYNWAMENEVRPGVKAIVSSALTDLRFLKESLEASHIKSLVEIGTCYGLSAALFAQYAENVSTFDVANFEGRQELWKNLEVQGKIGFFQIKNREDIKKWLDIIQFDFAFIDARHEVVEVRKDFALVKKCGRVLFHDVDEIRYPDNYAFLMEIEGDIVCGNTGYWEKK